MHQLRFLEVFCYNILPKMTCNTESAIFASTRMRLLPTLLFIATVAAQVFEDTPTLSALWQASSEGSTDAFINQIIQNRESAQHRAADGRGPMFWAYEFKNADTLALLLHLGVSADMEDVEGKKPKEFFPEGEGIEEFEEAAKAKMDELAKLLAEREEEFYSYQNSAPEGDDYDDEDAEGDAPDASKKTMDEIDCESPVLDPKLLSRRLFSTQKQ